MNAWIREANSTPVIYMTWAMKEEEAVQSRMTKAHQEIAEEIGALLAPVGEEWWQYKKNHPEIEMYAEDGAHASPGRLRSGGILQSAKPFGQSTIPRKEVVSCKIKCDKG